MTLPPLPPGTEHDTAVLTPLLSPLLAIGRAPLVDYLWLRAINLKEQGRDPSYHLPVVT